MQKQTVILLVGALFLLGAGGLVVQRSLGEPETPVGIWTAADEVDVPEAPEAAGTPLPEASDLERTAVDPEGARDGGEQRVAVILRGRVVDKFTQPVAEARVWLDFGRGGQRGGQQNRQRRVPEPVMTDREGRFAFQGQTFRNLQVTLQVLHRTHALGHFEKDIGDVGSEVDLGELVLNQGGELRGRVTDLDGNGIAAAELQLNPENGNQLRFARERLLAGATTDANGYFRCVNVPNGDWSANAVAKRHTEGRSEKFVIEEEQLAEIDDIRLGPGYEITGYVKSAQGHPIAKATVVMRSENRNRNPGGGARTGPDGGGGGRAGGGGGPGGGPGGREHRATTDEQGRFFLEHLPGASMRLETSADGYLDNTLTGIDPTSSPPVLVTLQDGLRIAGAVRDADAKPVTMFAARAFRVRGLSQPGRDLANLDEVFAQVRDNNRDWAQLRSRPEGSREGMVAEGRRGGRGVGPPDGGGGGGPGFRDLGRPERHAGGTFVLTGLQEGIYEVHVQSPDHTRYRSAEVELRLGTDPPGLSIVLDGGVFVAGVVRSEAGDPVAGARVELRPATPDEGTPRRPDRGNDRANSPDVQRLGRELRQAVAAMTFTQEATTGADGVFVIKHAQRGSYRLHAEARNYSGADSETFDLQADRSGFELRLGALGSIAGKVRGLAESEFSEARVAAVPIGASQGGGWAALLGRGRGGGQGGNPFQGVGCGPDGAYRIDGLVPGTYAVRAWIGSPQELMRELGPQFLDGSMLADVTVRAAEVATLDVTVTRPQVGAVSGTVMHNGTPAAGFQVELSRQDESGAPQNGFGGRRPGGGGRAEFFGGFGRSFQAAVAQSGNFSIPNVPAGIYRLRVQAARRGGLVHEEVVQVTVNSTTQCVVVLQTSNLEGSITRDDGGNAAELNGRVSLLPGLTAVPENLPAWQRENSSFDARLQNGAFKFTALKPGGYLLVLTVRGRERTTLPIVVGSTDQTVVVPAGKVVAAASPTPNGAPSSPRPTNRTPR